MFKACDLCRKKVRDYRHDNSEKINAQARRHQTKHYTLKQNRDKRKERCRKWKELHPQRFREWYLENLDHCLNYARKNYLINHDKNIKKTANWKKANPEKHRIHEHNRRARINGNGGKLPHNTEILLFKKQEGLCYLCGKLLFESFDDPPTIEHKIPVSRGGVNDISNVALAHLSCNDRKGTKTYEEFLEELNGKQSLP